MYCINILNKKSHMIILIGAEKILEENSKFIHNKHLQQSRRELHHTKGSYKKTKLTAEIILNAERLNSFYLTRETKGVHFYHFSSVLYSRFQLVP